MTPNPFISFQGSEASLWIRNSNQARNTTQHSRREKQLTLPEFIKPLWKLQLLFWIWFSINFSDNLSHHHINRKQIMRRDTRSNVQVAWFMSGAPKPLRRSRTLAHALGQPAPYQQQQQQRAPQAGFQTAPSYRRARWQRSRTAAQATSLLSSRLHSRKSFRNMHVENRKSATAGPF